MEPRLIEGADGRSRCWWCGDKDDYIAYHDDEWGRPVTDDRRLFEKMSLEGFQSGLSWLTILRKREGFRRGFKDFDFVQVARFNSRSVERLLKDASIVRHRGKIESVVNNASRVEALVEEFGSLSDFFWGYRVDGDFVGLRATSPESTAAAKELKRRGWTFVGPTTVYSLMQAMGVVNDHLPGCFVREACEKERRKLRR
ncbi:MAG: DNA-3-methyladenine glycosylase I [Acidobacteriota bacterium]